MKVVILCGGKGLRMKELTDDIPKPLATIGDKPIIWHIMKIYYHYGFNDFVLLLGYKGEKIKEYFMNYKWKSHNTILHENGSFDVLESSERWKITFLDTGLDTMTGGRIIKAKALLKDESFMLTYGDGLADIDLKALSDFHFIKNKVATVTGIRKKNQYGILSVKDNIATSFIEKPENNEIINGGFFVFNKEVFNYLDDCDECILEKEPLMNLVKDMQLAVYHHDGFWTAMDTYKEVLAANELWKKNESKWKIW